MKESLLHTSVAASARGNIQMSSLVVVITIALENKRSSRIRNHSSHSLNRFAIGGVGWLGRIQVLVVLAEFHCQSVQHHSDIVACGGYWPIVDWCVLDIVNKLGGGMEGQTERRMMNKQNVRVRKWPQPRWFIPASLTSLPHLHAFRSWGLARCWCGCRTVPSQTAVYIKGQSAL